MSQSVGHSFVDPAVALHSLPIKPGDKVADFGCGAGYFSLELAKRVGAEGEVKALDILPSALEAVASQAKRQGLGNLTVQRVNLEKLGGSKLLAESMDVVVLKDMLFQNKEKGVILAEVSRVLRPGGILFIMEWRPESKGVGPDPSLRITPEKLQGWLGEAGFTVDRELPVGGFHYAYLATK